MGVLIANKVVGYQSIELPAAASASATYWSFKTVTFKEVAGATDEKYFDITDILPKQSDGSDWTTAVSSAKNISNGQLVFQKITSTGAYSDRCQWTSRGTMKGWQTFPKAGSSETAKAIKRGEYVLKKGEGLIIAYAKTVKCLLQLAGEVELADMSTTIPAAASASATFWMFGGNFTPVKIDIRDVLPKQGDGSDWTTAVSSAKNISNGQLVFQKITSTGAYTDRCQWTSRGTMKGWQTFPKAGSGETAHALAADEWTLEPGEGYILSYSKTVPCKLIFPTPIPAAE